MDRGLVSAKFFSEAAVLIERPIEFLLETAEPLPERLPFRFGEGDIPLLAFAKDIFEEQGSHVALAKRGRGRPENGHVRRESATWGGPGR
jgi:hypothetical protein